MMTSDRPGRGIIMPQQTTAIISITIFIILYKWLRVYSDSYIFILKYLNYKWKKKKNTKQNNGKFDNYVRRNNTDDNNEIMIRN